MRSSPSKPILVFISGAWHSAAHFAPLINHLTDTCGYTCLTTPLPSVDPISPSTCTVETDVAHIRTFILNTLSTHKSNVTLVVHSYGAIPAMSAIHDLSATRLPTQPHIQSIALLCSFLLPPHVGLLDSNNGQPAPLHDVSVDKLLVNVAPPGPEVAFYGDLSPSEAAHWVSLMKPHSWPATIGRPAADSVGWLSIPTSYLLCKKDRATPELLQRTMIKNANELLEKQGSDLRIRVEEVESSHSPFLSMVERTGDFIRRAAGEDVPMSEA